MPHKEWVWGFWGPFIPFVQQRFVPDVVIQQDRRGRVVAPPAGGAGNQPAAPGAPVAPARPAYAGRIADDDLAREDLEEAREREMATDLRLRAEESKIWADLNEEAVRKMRNARIARRMRWVEQLPEAPIVPELPSPVPVEVQHERVERTPPVQHQPQRHTLSINGTVIRQGQTRMNVPNGYVTLDPAPGPQGYDYGTQVTLVANPVAGTRVYWRGASTPGGPFRAIVTMDRNRQVQLDITPPAPRTAPTPANPPGAGDAALDEQLARAAQLGI